MLSLTIRHWMARAGSLLPGACALCGASGRHALCAGCRCQFFTARPARCRRCALPLAAHSDAGRECGACLGARPAYDASVAATDYAAPVEQLVLGLKFGARLALAPLLAELMRDALLDAAGGAGAGTLADAGAAADVAVPASPLPPSLQSPGPQRPARTPGPAAARFPSALALPELLCPVPLGPGRLRERGFNQALEIARPLAQALGMPVAPRLLVRLRETPPQSRLSPQGRHSNLQGAFSLHPDQLAAVRGRHVGVVDDVMTTGATLHEIAALLHRFGAARVTNLVFARTLPA